MYVKCLAVGLCLLMAESGIGGWAKLGSAYNAPEREPVLSADEKNPKANSDPIYTSLRGIGFSGEYCPVENLIIKRDVAS